MAKRRVHFPLALVLPFGLGFLLTACDPGWNDFGFRIAWKPDSSLTGSDSCLQRFYLRGDRLGENIWCTPEAEPYMQAESQIEIILAPSEWRELKAQAQALKSDSAARKADLSTLSPGQAIVWLTEEHQRRGLLVSTHTDPKADSLIANIRQILLTRRPKRQK